MFEATPSDRFEFNHTPDVTSSGSEAPFKILALDALVITP
jgi:hypothetical protein